MGIALLKTIKSKLAFILMLTMLVSSIAVTVDAKFWEKGHKHKHKNDQTTQDSTAQGNDKTLSKKQQKKLKKEQKKKEKQEQKQERKKQKQERRNNRKHKNATVEAGTVSLVKVVKPEDEYPLTKMKDHYRVDILAALYLDELVKGESVTFKDKIPQKAEQGLAFYEGVLIAADSLKKAGFNIDIYVHDIASPTETPQMLVAEDKLDSTDLIIGAVQPRDIPMVAAYARKKQINFVSTTANTGSLKNNAYFTSMEPSLQSHCEWITGNVATHFPGMNIAVLYRASVSGDEMAYRLIADDNPYNAHYRLLRCDLLPGKEKLEALFDTTKPNVVIIPVQDTKYADSLLMVLSHDFPSTHFEVYGMPSWGSIKDLHKEDAFPNLSVNVTISFHADLSSPSGKYVTAIYKRDYGAKVPDLVYRGYETMFWYANLLNKYGTIFNVKYEDNTTAPFTSFEMKPRLDKNGNILFYENKHLFLSKYEGGLSRTE